MLTSNIDDLVIDTILEIRTTTISLEETMVTNFFSNVVTNLSFCTSILRS